MPRKALGEIIYPFPNFNGFTVEVWETEKSLHYTPYNGCNYLFINRMVKLQYRGLSSDSQGNIFVLSVDIVKRVTD